MAKKTQLEATTATKTPIKRLELGPESGSMLPPSDRLV
jgi:hypothetical protein